MKKIININLSGRVIPIEDSAYEKLQAYIESLRKYFSNEEGRDEIINDIESRIAELMNEKVRKGADRITDADVDEIAASMGRPEDFEADETPADQQTTSQQSASQQQESSYTNYSEKKGRRRLYRDTSDKVLGGVCSGIANYLNVDPAIIRILFAIVTFGGFGFGILVYGLLWMVLPAQDLEGFSGKRLYRNPDDKVIGGVAGGLAAYFKREPWVIRLIFASPILIVALASIFSAAIYHYNFHFVPNILFGSLSGTFIFIYIILWIVLPEASSQYEKMEMRGEKVDVNTIRQNVKEGIQQTKDKLKGWGSEVKESAQNFGDKAKEFANTRGKSFAAEANQAVRRTSRGIGHAIGVIFKAFFLFIAGSIALGLFVALIALLFTGIAWWPVNHFLWTSKWQQLYAWGTLIFFLGVPLIAFIIWIIRRIIRVRSRSGYLGWTFAGLWIIGWVCATLFAASISRDLREYEHTDIPIAITQPLKGKMLVKVSEPELEYTGSFSWINDESTGWDLTEDTMKLSAIRFNIELSDDSDYHVIMKKYSAGTTRGEARQRAEKIIYNVSYKDSVLDLGSGYSIYKDSKFRGQKIEMEIQVPVNKKIRFDESVQDKLNPINIRVRRYHGRRNGTDIIINENGYFPWDVNTDYVMGKNGVLSNPDKPKTTTQDEDYRYKQSTDSTDIDKSIEQKEKELNDLKEKKKKQKTTIGYIEDKFDNERSNAVVIIPSPVFSLTSTFN